MKKIDNVSFGGGRSERTFILPAHKVTIGPDTINLRLQCMNSYDGSTAVSTMFGAFVVACANGMVIGEKYAGTYGRHTKNVSIEAMVEKIEEGIEAWHDEAQRWERMNKSKISSDDEVKSVLKGIPEVTERLSDNIVGLYNEKYAGSHGNNLWAVYMAATDWATHGDVRKGSEDNRGAITNERDLRVRSMIRSNAFNNRLAASCATTLAQMKEGAVALSDILTRVKLNSNVSRSEFNSSSRIVTTLSMHARSASRKLKHAFGVF